MGGCQLSVGSRFKANLLPTNPCPLPTKKMLALIPLDNRPCNVRFPQQIAAIGATELLVPPNEVLGYFTTAGQPASLAQWLHNLPEIEGLIVSSDMLAYGGLVASRRGTPPLQNALDNLQILRQWHEAHPQTPIYAFSILMRLAVTMESDAAAANYYNIMRYARLADEAERFNSEHLQQELEEVIAQIPPEILDDYHAARARNHAVNLQMLEWLAQGVFQYLLITQEDAAEYGLHRQEQDILLKRAQKLGVSEKMSLHPGADEAALTLLARHWKSGVRFRIHWSNSAHARHIAPFEDRPYDKALHEHIKAMCGTIIEPSGECDFELFVNAPIGGHQKDEGETERANRASHLETFLTAMQIAIENGRRVALCDVAFPNGADNLLLNELDQRRLLGKISVFGAWNTAGNTTGTVLAQCAALLRGGPEQGFVKTAQLNRAFVLDRLLDDWCYQSNVRGRAEKTARERGFSPLNMGAAGESIEAQTSREIKGFAQALARRHFKGELKRCDVRLPWMRTFECEVQTELT